MTHWTEAAEMLDERNAAPPSLLARYAPGAFAFVMSAALGVYLVYLRPHMFTPRVVEPAAAPLPVKPGKPVKPDTFGGLAPVTPAPSLAANPFGGLVTRGFEAPARFSLAEQTPDAPLPPVAPPDLRSLPEEAPLPPRRPSELSSQPQRPGPVARLEPRPSAAPPPPPPAVATTAPAPAPSETQGVFEKLFGGASRPTGRGQDTRMAYAAPPPVSSASGLSVVPSGRGGAPGPAGFGGFLRGLSFSGGPSSRYGEHVAVYDISAHVVYLPDGTKLEAHSGLGSLRDDPGSVAEKMRGVTPPATYALTPREASFHGVEALRLTPLDSGVFGRAGLLAHSYMLGPDGDSNGCVSFRDYEAFLRAYRSGQISKLVVVTRL